MDYMKKMLYELTSYVGVSGEEQNMSGTIQKLLPSEAEVRTDALGNIIAEFKGRAYPFCLTLILIK